MKRISVLLFLLFTIVTILNAGNIKGRIIDAETNQPMDYVNVAVFQKGSDKLFKGEATNASGAFTFKDLKAGIYSIKITFIGYIPIELPITLSAAHPDADLKTIKLSPDTKRLKEVEVVGQRSQMKFEVDRKVFSVDQNIASAGGSASEVLQNIPSVDVDTEGNISLRNNSNVVVWINGRPSGLSEDNRAQILEQMPAESIESIEVITNPSAKYSPEGSAGIINLVLKKDRKAGYYGSVSAGGNTLGGYNGAVNFNINSGKFDAYAGVGIRGMNFTNTTHTERQSWKNGGMDTTSLIQDNNGKMWGNGTTLRTGVTYSPSASDQIGLTAFGMLGNRSNRSTLLSANEKGEITRDRNTGSKSNHDMVEISLDYTHKFNKTSDLKLYAGFNARDWSDNSWFNQKLPQSVQEQSSDDTNKEWEFQADYSNQLNDLFKLETGYKGNINSKYSNVKTSEGLTAGGLTERPDLNNIFDYNENIQALYGTFSGKIDKFSFQAGLRGEYMRYKTETRSETQPIPPTLREYWQLYPSAFISYGLPKGNELQLNYTRRVNRPRGRQLNSFRNITDSTNITYGNPNLNPEFSNSIEFNYVKSWEQHTLSASLYYRNTDGVIQQVSFLQGNTLYQTYENITNSQSSGLELVSKNRLFSILDLTSTVNLYQYKLNGFNYEYVNNGISGQVSYAGDKSFSWDARIMANMMFRKNFSAQITGSYRSKQVVAQGERLASYNLDAGVRKTFLNRKLNIAITGRDLLNSRKRKNISMGENFYQVSESQFSGRSIGISVTYMFGKNGNSTKKNNKRDNSNESFESEMMDF